MDKNDKSWLKLLPAAAVFAAVCITCYQAEKSPVETATVSDNSVMSVKEIKELIQTGTTEKANTDASSQKEKASAEKKSKKAKKTSKIKTGTKKNATSGAAAKGSASAGGAGTTTTPTTTVPADGYVDGTYTGSGTGFGGTVTVQVTVSGHKITAINILDASSETPAYFANAKGVINKILSGQTPNVDAVSGATYSSNGIIQAVQNALFQAIPSGNQAGVTPTPTSTPTPKPTKKPVPTPKPGEEQIYKDGTYTGTGKGYSGTITLTAKIKKGVITSLKVENTDTPAFFQKAWDRLEEEILEKQAAEGIDTVSGATYSSKGILEAFRDILKQAKKGEAKPTVTPEITPTEAPTPTITPAPTVTPTPEASLTPEPSPAPEASPTPEPTAVPEPEGRYIDGTYTASSYGYEGMVNVTVTISGGQIVSIEQSNGDSPEYFDYAWNTILPQVTANQSTEGIDAASGATYSSEGILNAIRKALAQAAR